MSITKDTLQKHLTDPAVFCCRRAKGTVIGADDLEDPTLFDDMVDAGLLTLSDDGLTIEEVLGSTLQKDVEALTPITKDVLDKVNPKSAKPVETVPAAAPAKAAAPEAAPSGTIHLKIDKLEGLSLDIPAGTVLGASGVLPAAETGRGEKKVIRTLLKKHIKITDVEISDHTAIKDGKIFIDGSIVDKAVKEDPLCVSMSLDGSKIGRAHV